MESNVHIVFVDCGLKGNLIKSEPVKRFLRQARKNAGVLHHLLYIRVTAIQLLSSGENYLKEMLVKVTNTKVKVKQSFIGVVLQINRKQ